MREPMENSSDAGLQLAKALEPYQREPCIILALPRGGVVVGYEVARHLHKPLDVIVVRKVGAPGHEELAVGAIGPNDVLIWNRDVLMYLRANPATLEERVQQEKIELARRLETFRGNRPFPKVEGRTVILVDDGLATGATARAAVKAVKAMKPGKLVLAVPVGSHSTVSELRHDVDELVCLETPDYFEAVSQWYISFPQNTDQEVIQLLQNAWHEETQQSTSR
jgi:putative phosphoribosyl transferase